MTQFMIGICVFLMLLIFVALARAVVGPTAIDRILAINIIGTKTVAIIAVISYVFGEVFFLDVAIVYALISFLMTVSVAKYLEMGNIS
ncbi:MAG: cation:proton antiporter [Firmicutes bacterium]|nr:cation:proton antiporter [Bacillota bacterium]